MSDILVIDDDPTFAEVLARALIRRGYGAVTAHDAATALALMARGHFSRVVLDLRLAHESGLDLVRHLRALEPSVRIVILTGYASIATAVEAIKLGAHHYLTKPAEISSLLAAFEHEPGHAAPAPPATPHSLERIEWETIQQALVEAEGNISAAAARLGPHRRTLQRKLKKRPSGLS